MKNATCERSTYYISRQSCYQMSVLCTSISILVDLIYSSRITRIHKEFSLHNSYFRVSLLFVPMTYQDAHLGHTPDPGLVTKLHRECQVDFTGNDACRYYEKEVWDNFRVVGLRASPAG